jgi:hypothetical protein
MHDLFANVDGCAKCLKRDPDDVDRPHYSRAKTSGLQKQDAFGCRGSAAVGYSSLIKGRSNHLSSISCPVGKFPKMGTSKGALPAASS